MFVQVIWLSWSDMCVWACIIFLIWTERSGREIRQGQLLTDHLVIDLILYIYIYIIIAWNASVVQTGDSKSTWKVYAACSSFLYFKIFLLSHTFNLTSFQSFREFPSWTPFSFIFLFFFSFLINLSNTYIYLV